MVSRKLTLTVDPDVIDAAKQYAADHGTSVSQLVEAFLAAVAAEPASTHDGPVLSRLRGTLRGTSADDHRRHLAEKHGA